MDVGTIKLSYGNINVDETVLEKLGFIKVADSIWQSPSIPLNIRYGGKSYYNQENVYIEGQINKRIDITTINDLIDLYTKLSAEEDLFKLVWNNL